MAYLRSYFKLNHPARHPYLQTASAIDISICGPDTTGELGRARLLGVALAIALLGAQGLPSLPALAASPTAPIVIQSLKNDTSPALRTMHASPVPPEGKGSQPNLPLHPGRSGAKLPTALNSIQMTAGSANMPSTNPNFEGVNNIDGVLPPDTNGDVGPKDYVQWVNLHFEIFDRTGTPVLGPSAGNTLWSGFGGLCEFTNQGDPVVRYDRMANRWVFTQFAFSTRHGAPIAPFDQCFAVSTTGDPTGSYFRYAWQISNTNFPDYPKLAVWPDAYYMSVNFFSSNLTTFVGAGALAFDRNKMLTNQGPTAILFGPTSSNFGGLLPSDLDGSILPPSGSPNYFGAIDTAAGSSGNTFQIWKFHVDFITPTKSTFGTASQTPNFNLSVDTYFWNMCPGTRSCIQQPVTSQGLDALSDRLMNRLPYRRFADGHESLVANHTVGVGSSGNQGAVRWYEIRGLSTTPTIYQQGTYSPSGDSHWMGSIAMDQSGDIALGYSVSSSSVFPSVWYTGRLAGDPLGTLPQGEASIVVGSGSQTSSTNRWGDYSMMAVDPTDDCAFWYTQEYYTATSTASWRTRVGSFKFPNCGPPVVAGAAGTDGALYVLRSWSAGWVSLGGGLLGAPAVVSIPQVSGPGAALYVVTGTDHNLYVRNDANGWQALTTSPLYCIDSPAGVVISGTLYVACQGADHALWQAQAPAPSGTSLPVLSASAWNTLGGTLAAGPAIASVSGTPTYFVLGTDQHIWVRTLTTGYGQSPWTCVGHPAAASFGSTSYFACHGTDNALWYASNTGSGWNAAQSLGGALTDGVGIAVTSSGPVFFVEGTDGEVWQRSGTTGWANDGGHVTYGAGGTALT